MNSTSLIEALDLPASSRVDQRVPKKLLLENGAPILADKRTISDGIEELFWLAALKPTTIGVLEYRDKVREYLEIAVLRLTLRDAAKRGRLIELVHRAVPYPLLLLSEQRERRGISAVHKRWSLGETGSTVLESDVVLIEYDSEQDAEVWFSFCEALAFGNQPQSTLYALYQGWIDTLLALQVARITGKFTVAADAEHAFTRRVALQECVRLDDEIARLRAAASREKQLARRVELNLELRRLETVQAAERMKL